MLKQMKAGQGKSGRTGDKRDKQQIDGYAEITGVQRR
jgi:hypothetical protein